jgi:hypothetical protein
MSEEKKAFRKPPGFGQPDSPEQKALRKEGEKYGLKFRGRPKAETMRRMLDEHIASLNASPEPQAPTVEPVVETPVPTVQNDAAVAEMPPAPGVKLYLTEEEYKDRQAREAKRDAGRLVRCRITCMNPNKKNWTGEIVSVGSARVGTFKKFIPFNNDEPYHIPKIIFEHLKERKCAIRNIRKTPDGKEHIDVKLINEFSLDVLPPLTAAELEDLRQRQAMAKGAA